MTVPNGMEAPGVPGRRAPGPTPPGPILLAWGLLTAAIGVVLQGPQVGRLLAGTAHLSPSTSVALADLLAGTLAVTSALVALNRTRRVGLAVSSLVHCAIALVFALALMTGETYGCGCSGGGGSWVNLGLLMAALTGLLLSEGLHIRPERRQGGAR